MESPDATSTPAAGSPGATARHTLQVAATALHDNDGNVVTDLGGIDVRYRPTPSTEIRAEMAVSDTRASGGARGACPKRHRDRLADRGRAS